MITVALLCAASLLTACGNDAVTPDGTDPADTAQTSVDADSTALSDSKDPADTSQTLVNSSDADSNTSSGDTDPADTSQTPDDVSEVDYTGYTDEEFLAAVNIWQNKDVPGIIWTFNDDSTGRLTTDNERNVYDLTWSLSDDILRFEIADWPYIDDVQTFTITTDKETPSFGSHNNATDSEAVFVPWGTVPFPVYEDNKPEELLGAWIQKVNDPERTSVFAWYLNTKAERSAYAEYYINDKELHIQYYYDDWNKVGDNSLVYVFEDGRESVYTYTLEGNTLNLTSGSGNQVVLEKLDLSGVEVLE